MLAQTLRALLSHWKRRPWQAAALLIGLATATALWSGVQALNSEARQSYDRAASLLGADQYTTIAVAGGVPMAQSDYIALRRAGWRVSPILEGTYVSNNRPYRLIGIDPLTLPPNALGTAAIEGAEDLSSFLAPPYRIFTGPGTAEALANTGLPPFTIVEDLPQGTLIADIGFVQATLGQTGEITRLIVAPTQKPSRQPLANITQTRLIATPPRETPELASLTNSFHLNLTAFGLLSFVVGLFIVHATIGLAFEQRRSLLRTLRALGTPQRTLLTALAMELGLLALTAGAAGTALGYLIAASLLPDVAASLRGLYGAQVPGTLTLSPLWWLAGLAISLAGAALAATTSFWKAARLSILAPVGTEAWLSSELAAHKVQRRLAAVLLAGAALTTFSTHLLAGFALMGAVLMAAALLLPSLLSALITILARTARTPVAEWFWADTRAQLGGLSLALMALLLALSVNIGVGTMVDGFRQTFLAYLDKRLASELYIYAETDAQAEAIRTRLETDKNVTATLPIWNAEARFRDWPVSVYGFEDHPTYRESWPLIDATSTPWDDTATGTATIISEQFARRFALQPGDTITLPTPKDDWPLSVAGIYADYGNPTGQMLIPMPELLSRWPDVEKRRYGVRTSAAHAARLAETLTEDFQLSAQQIVDQSALKGISRRIFETTFTVTIALNALTLAVAGLALFTSLLTLATLRLPQLAPAWAMGLTRARLSKLELLRTTALALFTALAAIPLGLAVAWILTAVINVKAFGWKLPLFLFPDQWLKLTALALVTAALASAIPALRLAKMRPTDLLGLFSHER